ncbi:hypothetical protein N8703_03710 [Verrucomicrobia bacterium]|nr:hypothetical protein [Verrucomicrobiota bacterium]
MSKQRTESQEEEQPLTSEDWNFTGIPQEELWIARIYEYSREIKVVREAFNDWLNCAFGIEMGDFPENEYFSVGKTVRELLCEYKLPDEVPTAFSDQTPITYSDLYEIAGDHLAGHDLMKIMEVLGHWPTPYKVARKTPSGKHGIKSLLSEESVFKSVRWATKSDLNDRPGPNYLLARIVIDRRATKANLKKQFGEMCDSLLSSKRGRKENITPPIIKLRQLSAYRLFERGIGKGRIFPSYERLEIALGQLNSKKSNQILPFYADLKGFQDAVRRGEKHLSRLNQYWRYKKQTLANGWIDNNSDGEWADFPSSEQ